MSYSSNDGSNSGRSMTVGVLGFAVPIVVVAGLIYYVVSHTPSSGAANVSMIPAAVNERIQRVGSVAMRDAGGAKEARSGEEVFSKGPCTTCHTAGALGAPKFGDKAAWAPRIAKGYEALLQSALKGRNSMPAQGGGDYSDIEVGRALVYMANAAGASFPVPQAAAPAAAPAASAAK